MSKRSKFLYLITRRYRKNIYLIAQAYKLLFLHRFHISKV